MFRIDWGKCKENVTEVLPGELAGFASIVCRRSARTHAHTCGHNPTPNFPHLRMHTHAAAPGDLLTFAHPRCRLHVTSMRARRFFFRGVGQTFSALPKSFLLRERWGQSSRFSSPPSTLVDRGRRRRQMPPLCRMARAPTGQMSDGCRNQCRRTSGRRSASSVERLAFGPSRGGSVRKGSRRRGGVTVRPSCVRRLCARTCGPGDAASPGS